MGNPSKPASVWKRVKNLRWLESNMQVYSVMSLVLHVLPLLQQNYQKLWTLIKWPQVPIGGIQKSAMMIVHPIGTHNETSHKDPPPSTLSDLNCRELSVKNCHCELCGADYQKKIVYYTHLDWHMPTILTSVVNVRSSYFSKTVFDMHVESVATL